MTALLHDVLDDGDGTLADVEAHAGRTVAALVSSVARLSRNNQLLRRAYRRMIAAGENVRAEAEIEAMKSMILQMTEEPLVRPAHHHFGWLVLGAFLNKFCEYAFFSLGMAKVYRLAKSCLHAGDHCQASGPPPQHAYCLGAAAGKGAVSR